MNRFAIYYTPPPGALETFGARWLGWDPMQGIEPQPLSLEGLLVPREDITSTPRKYGLHATMKAPFALADDVDEAALRAGLQRFCATQPPAVCDGLALTRLGGFLALTPVGDTTAIDTLAAATVRDLDAFRAPMTEAYRARRMASTLSAEQIGYLDRWGYPFVMDAFRFHITLSGRLADENAKAVQTVLQDAIAPVLPQPFVIDALSLCGEDDAERFHVRDRVPLTGS